MTWACEVSTSAEGSVTITGGRSSELEVGDQDGATHSLEVEAAFDLEVDLAAAETLVLELVDP